MKKYTSEEAFYSRMNKLAEVKKSSVNETNTRNLGTLIDIQRAANGVAYGIIKEQHKYYIKKGGLNENQSVADFAYIGGLENLTEFEYTKLSEAQKNRNFLLQTVNEGFQPQVKKTTKKGMLTEDKAAKEIDNAENKLGDLEAATAAAEVPAEPEMPVDGGDGAAEMDAGLDAMGGEELPADGGEMPAADAMGGGEELPADGAEMPADGAMGGEELPADGAEMPADGGEGQEEDLSQLQKDVSEIGQTIEQENLQDGDVKWLVDRFLKSFRNGSDDKLKNLEISDRQELADIILNVVDDEDKEDLGQNVEDTDGDAGIEMEEQECAECGGFAQYAESRGYDAQSMMECGDEEMANVVSGYANAHSEGQNDGDFKVVALFITPEILEKLKSEYGHDDFAGEVEPFSNEMNETSAEDKEAQINELFGGLKGAMGSIKKGVGDKVQQGVDAVKQKAQQVQQGVQQAATNVKQGYHAGEVPAEVKKLEGEASKLGKQITALNARLVKAGKEEVDIKKIMTAISQEVGASKTQGGIAGLGIAEDEGGIPVDSVEVMPPLEEEVVEEDVTLKVGEKAGKKLSPDNVPQVEMKEGEEPEGDDVESLDIDSLDVDAEETPEVPAEDDVLDLTKDREKPNAEFGVGFDSMGGGVVKPEGAEVTTVEVTKDSVKVEMNEGEAKLRKYIRNRLEEKAGLRKPSLNEDKKSETLIKLDKMINEQFELFETTTLEKIKK